MGLDADLQYLKRGSELRQRTKPVRIRQQDKNGYPDKMYVVTGSNLEPIEVCFSKTMAETLAITVGGLYKLVPVIGENYLFND